MSPEMMKELETRLLAAAGIGGTLDEVRGRSVKFTCSTDAPASIKKTGESGAFITGATVLFDGTEKLALNTTAAVDVLGGQLAVLVYTMDSKPCWKAIVRETSDSHPETWVVESIEFPVFRSRAADEPA